ncbi:hypothetical protein ABT373_27180 [Streptomyces sp. NPDC000070]
MPRETDTENLYGYAPETETVRVGQHDLERLVLMFRAMVWQMGPHEGQ